MAVPRKKLASVLTDVFAIWRKETVRAVRALGKADSNDDEIDKILDAVQTGHLRVIQTDVEPLLEAIGKDAGLVALAQVGITDDASIVDLVNQFAVDYARDRAAEMVGMSVDEHGALVENPDPEWAIDDATRDLLRGDVSAAMSEGLSNDALAERIGSSYAFSDERAETIARTETAFADVAGNLNAYRESGQVESKMWITGAECCDDCWDLDGVVVALDEDFPDDGGDGPPLPPNCRCDVSPILKDSDTSEGDDTSGDE